MNSITYVGMDVHTTSYTLCCYTPEEDRVFAHVKVEPDYRSVLKYLSEVQRQIGQTEFVCGYEAGCLGYVLQKQLSKNGVNCVILAPSTMATPVGKRVKTDKRDAELISRCLAYHQYKAVYVPNEEDDSVKEYIRMRNDVKQQLKSLKQQIIAFCTRHGHLYDGNYWTQRHLKWVEELVFPNQLYKETLNEYLALFYGLQGKLDAFDIRIEEISKSEKYEKPVQKLCCFSGISTNTAMSFLSEVCDFHRFPSADQFASYLGLVPGEYSSGEKNCKTGITKAGNSHLRLLLTEAAQHYARGSIGKKSKRILEKQKGNPPEVISYADKANERLKRKFYRIALHSKHNIAKTAVARELACFIWGMMTENY